VNGCSASSIITLSSSGTGITGSAVSTPTSCPGVSNGTISVTAASGLPPYSYALNGGSPQSSNIFTGVAAGSHSVIIRDAGGCPATVTVTVVSGTSLTGTANSTSTSCSGLNNGTVTAVATSGNPPYSYSLNGGVTYQSTATFSGLAPGSYSITIRENAGCTGTVTAVVLAGTNISSSVSVTNPACANSNTGVIIINPLSGNSPYQYSINGGTAQSSNIFSNLSPGIYSISITDNVGCTGTNNTTLTSNTALAAQLSFLLPLCNGAATGSININVSGGITPYQYSMNAGASYQTASTFNTLAAGTYTIRIRDNAGCTKDTIVILTQPLPITASAISTDATCNGNDGTITVTGSGGIPAYQYSISGPSGYQANPILTAPAVGPYSISVKDANGCIATTNTVVNYTDNMFLSLGNDTLICAEQSIVLQPNTNPGASVFQWTPANTLSSAFIKNPKAAPLSTTTYILNAQFGPCSRRDSITISVLKKPVADAGPAITICDNDSTLLTGSVSNNSGAVGYQWSPAETVLNATASSTIAFPTLTQLYVLSIKDNYGCNFLVKDSVTVTVRPPVPAFGGNDTTSVLNQPHQLMASGGSSYLWNPTANLDNPFSPSPIATLNADTRFIVLVTDVAGCTGSDTVLIKAYIGPTYHVPNAFSPNGDGLNDVFRAIPVGITQTDYFRVFNRYGELIFETNQWMKGWDGTFKGKKQPTGVYVWIIKGKSRQGTTVEMKGTVMLVQ
jgi:gliding motility-associated-like protein